jgi:very-short-patch-repair endonuclease
MTEAERALWRRLRKRQLKGCLFRRQFALGRYIVDFVCLQQRLIIEIDGGQHNDQQTYDAKRTTWLEAQGYRVLRFWSNDVLERIDAVVEIIAAAIGSRQ